MCSYQDIEPIGRLEAEITELAAQIHAATCRWLSLVAEFDRRAAGPHGAPAAARTGSRGGARSRRRRRVSMCASPAGCEELPLIRDAFADGRLSYSKVRALTRMEQPAREAELLELARIATAAQLERLVRGYRRVVATERAAAGGGPERWVRWSEDDDGSLLIQARVPAEDGAIVLKALEAAVDRLETGGEPAAGGEALPRKRLCRSRTFPRKRPPLPALARRAARRRAAAARRQLPRTRAGGSRGRSLPGRAARRRRDARRRRRSGRARGRHAAARPRPPAAWPATPRSCRCWRRAAGH